MFCQPDVINCRAQGDQLGEMDGFNLMRIKESFLQCIFLSDLKLGFFHNYVVLFQANKLISGGPMPETEEKSFHIKALTFVWVWHHNCFVGLVPIRRTSLKTAHWFHGVLYHS